jgi:hypothetical protein
MATLNGKVILFGGFRAGTGGIDLGDTWSFDGTGWTQLTITGPSARRLFGMATLNGKIILFGGVSGGGSYLGDTWAFDGATWSELNVSGAPSPSRRGQFSMTTVRDRILLFGGRVPLTGQDSMAVGDTWTFDGAVWTMVSTTGPSARDLAAMGTL